MFSSPVIDTVLSIAFIYFIFSVITSFFVEYLTFRRKQRGIFLYQALSKVLQDNGINKKNFTHRLYEHPMIRSMKESNEEFPSYISDTMFSQCLIDIVIADQQNTTVSQDSNNQFVFHSNNTVHPYEAFTNAVQQLKYSDLKIFLETFIHQSANISAQSSTSISIDRSAKQYELLQSHIQNWYNSYMDRVSGWYKRKLSKTLLIIGILVATVFNLDSLVIIKRLWVDKQLRETLTKDANTYIANNPKYEELANKDPNKLISKIDSIYTKVGLYNLPIGWGNEQDTIAVNKQHSQIIQYSDSNIYKKIGWYLMKVLGILLSGIALSFGAPFWFDVMNKITNMRKAGIKPKTT